jgi:alpha-L-rhamnosidase
LVVSDGNARTVQPQFTWFGFRYFEVIGNAIPRSVSFVHANVPVTSSFACDNVTLNWIYRTFLHTMLCNMHTGHPSDCPHLERRGYTGDGQLTCHAALSTLGGKSFYEKWLQDIADCQDVLSGHIQYTAPYVRSGGGPGGWGCAIVVLPYEYWKFYGDDCFARELYPQMLQYFEFMETHSENLLVKVDMPVDAWCLGEWAATDPIVMSAPFVNNYFYVKSMEKAIEIARHIGRDEDIPMLEARIAERKHATDVAYRNTWDSNFFGCLQGANAFALDMGIGDERTKTNLINYYENKNPYYDTGIFGTDIVTRVLFEYGRPDLAYKLLTADEPYGFGKWMKQDATTFWEYWYDRRSHNHPMFGAVLAYFFEYILGIRQKKDSYGYRRITVNPVFIKELTHAKGHITVEQGEIAVGYTTDENGIRTVTLSIPAGVEAEIVRPDGTTEILCGPAVKAF